jgi:hypothetical protein
MSKRFRFLSALALIASTACVIEDDGDDDAAGDTANTAASNTNSASDSDSTNVTTANDTSAGSSGAVDSSSGTGGATGCGWGDLPGQDNVDEGYTCGGAGEDPKEVFPIECPAAVELVAGGDCGGDMGVTGVGCCDGTTVWYCADNGSGAQLFSEACG